MIKIIKSESFDELFGDTIIRHFSKTRVVGYLVAVNHTPSTASWSDILNVDVVISHHSNLFGKYTFEYTPAGERLARRGRWAMGEFRHMHLMANQNQINQLQSLLYKKIKIEADEIALSHPARGSFFWVDERVPFWLGLPAGHPLVFQTRAAALQNQVLNRSSCHSIKPTNIERAGFFTF